jgi:hypothetical protein
MGHRQDRALVTTELKLANLVNGYCRYRSRPGVDPRLADWGRGYWKTLHPLRVGGGYVNLIMHDEDQSRLKAAYGKYYERLAGIKRKYDPANLFSVNHNIQPA